MYANARPPNEKDIEKKRKQQKTLSSEGSSNGCGEAMVERICGKVTFEFRVKYLIITHADYVCLSVCLSVCLFVRNIAQKRMI